MTAGFIMLQFLANTQIGCRRSFSCYLLHQISTLAILSLAAITSQLVSAQSLAAESSRRPNIVVIMADDMGYSDLGCFGGEIKTPNLDRLAEGGLRFTNFYSENMCWVSRAAMLTGIYHKTSMVKNALHPRCVTLAEAVRGNGYQTRMSGKWHLAGKPYHIYPNDRGFDQFYGILGGAASFFAPASLCRNRTNIEPEAHNDPDFYFTDAVSYEAQRMIHEAAVDRPLFLSVAYTAAHWPLHAPEQDVSAYKGSYAIGWDQLREQRLERMKQLGIVRDDVTLSNRHPNVPSWQNELHKEWQQRRMEVYAAQVTVMDRGIGRIIDALKQTGRIENTLIFFTIDNGGCHVEYTPDRKGDFLPGTTRDGRPVRPGNLPEIMPGPEDTYQSYGHGWANVSNTPYRLFKQYDHEGGIRTPMIAHWPNGITATGRLVPTVSHLIDIMPTVLEVTGTTVPEEISGGTPVQMDGISLAGVFTGESFAGHETLFFHHNKGQALRHGDWKLVAAKQNKKKTSWELYNLKQDPTEQQDLADRMPQKVGELSLIWDAESARLATQAHID
ncbi:MAG: arylsulfatase [Fuerstiella sp.]